MKRFQLTASMLIGHSVIDAEHEQLVALYNAFVDCLEAGHDRGCAGKLDELIKALESHLEHEERIMEEFGYGQLGTHKINHGVALRSIETLRIDADRDGYGSDFVKKLAFILLDDLIKNDLGLRSYLQQIGYRE